MFNIAQSLNAFEISGVKADGKNTPITAPARFLFATEDGTIVGWNPNVNPMGFDPAKVGTYGIIAVDNSNNPIVGQGAVYKGLAIAADSLGVPRLYATNFRAGTVEVFAASFLPANSSGAFADPKLPKGYAPFNIFPIGSATAPATAKQLVVTYAVQNAEKHDDVAGMSHGIVNTFDLNGQSFQRLIQHGQLNSPWGVAVAPGSFGALAGSLLIGNFGNGHINAYNPTTGEFMVRRSSSMDCGTFVSAMGAMGATSIRSISPRVRTASRTASSVLFHRAHNQGCSSGSACVSARKSEPPVGTEKIGPGHRLGSIDEAMPPISIAMSRKPPSELYLKKAVRIASELSQESLYRTVQVYHVQLSPPG